MPKISYVTSRRAGGEGVAGSRNERPITVRLDERRLQLMTGLALVDESTVAEQIRQASDLYISHRANDPDLHDQVALAIARFRSKIAPVAGAASDQEAGAPDGPSAPERDIESERPVTLRLASGTFEYFTSLAILDDFTIADELRAAVDLYLDQRRRDPELEKQIRDANEDRQHLLDRLQTA